MPTLSRRSFVVGAGLLLAASSIALLLALILTVNVRLAALFLGGLTGAFLVVVGAAITIQTAFTKEDTHTALWVGPLILVVGALALPGAIAGWRHRAVGARCCCCPSAATCSLSSTSVTSASSSRHRSSRSHWPS